MRMVSYAKIQKRVPGASTKLSLKRKLPQRFLPTLCGELFAERPDTVGATAELVCKAMRQYEHTMKYFPCSRNNVYRRMFAELQGTLFELISVLLS